MENNLFKFATKETTQDSFFSYIINGYNNSDKKEYKTLAKCFLKEISPKGLKKEIDKLSNIRIIRQFLGIDILVVLNFINHKQKLLIIENKTSSGLTDNQKDTILYYTKLLNALEKAKKTSNQESRNIQVFNNHGIDYKYSNNKDNIYSVLIRTNLEYGKDYSLDEKEIKSNTNKLDKKYTFLKNNNFFIKHINFINNPSKLSSLLSLFKEYQFVDSLIKGYYQVMQFNLENESLLNYSENSVNYINKNELMNYNTHFRTAYLCLACFNNILTSPIDIKNEEKIETRNSERKINIDIHFNNDSEFNEFKVRTFDFNSGNNFNNRFIDGDMWSYESKNENKNVRYIFLFIKKIDQFNNEYYEFNGLFRRYKQLKIKKNRYQHVWERCNNHFMKKNGKLMISKKEIINYIKLIENNKL